jgi:hypothetical protein
MNYPAPRLELGLANGDSVLSWIIPSIPFVLQQTLELSNQQWTDVPIAPNAVFTNLYYQVTRPATDQRGFYRLKGTL